MDTSAGSAYGTRTFSTKSAMNETYYSVYSSSIWVHCIGSMARASEGPSEKVATHSSWVMGRREGRVGQETHPGLSEPRTGSSELWKKITQTQTGEVQTTIRPFISRTSIIVSECTFSNLANLELELELYDTAYPNQ